MKLVYATVVIRHGARAPQNAYLPLAQRGHWVCDGEDAYAPRLIGSKDSEYRRYKQIFDPRLVEFLPNCRAGDLLLQGMEQHHQLGEMYHKYFFETTKLFDSNDANNNNYVFARSTDFDRTLRSAESFLGGAFPPLKPFEKITINRGSEYLELLRPSSDFCQDIKDIYTKLDADPDYLNYTNTMWNKIKHIADEFGVTYSSSNLNLVANWVVTLECNGQQLPSFVKTEDLELCQRITADLMYIAFKKNTTVFVSYAMRELLRVAKEAVNGGNQFKFSLLSSHDSTVGTFLTYLGYQATETIPPYASHLLMEIWKSGEQRYVRWSFNGEVLKIFGGTNEYMKWEDFVEKTNEVYQYCKELP
ncbi:histidine acid phosphatase [Histomonas meleagridis]|uniref:histidine acid phosphatase n=1 Tax=Histomonas meleagridis TaxID=135588 RepID=UPI003559BF65|nr:histidine acid phosphatase [Histomonas meleagridis]KAH0799956.1 histidine acid phosphatase [Histomonas meleagridis]